MKADILITIIRTLNNQPQTTAAELANKLGVSKRTVYRYVEELTVAGIPISSSFGRYGGLSLDKQYRKSKDKITV